MNVKNRAFEFRFWFKTSQQRKMNNLMAKDLEKKCQNERERERESR